MSGYFQRVAEEAEREQERTGADNMAKMHEDTKRLLHISDERVNRLSARIHELEAQLLEASELLEKPIGHGVGILCVSEAVRVVLAQLAAANETIADLRDLAYNRAPSLAADEANRQTEELRKQLADAQREQSRRAQWLPSSGPMTENEFRLLFSESVCESDFPLVDDDGEFTTEAIDRLTNIAEGTAERLFVERDAAVKRAEVAEAQLAGANAKLNTEMAEHTREVLRNGVLEAQLAEALKQVATLKVQLSEEYRDWMKDQCNEGCDYGMRMYLEAKAQLAEAKLALVETVEDATEGAEKHIRRAEAAEARAEAAHSAKRIAEDEQLVTAAELDEANALLELYRRFHGKVGCPGGEDCYVCSAETVYALKQQERELLKHGDPLSGGDYQTMQDVRSALADKGDGAED